MTGGVNAAVSAAVSDPKARPIADALDAGGVVDPGGACREDGSVVEVTQGLTSGLGLGSVVEVACGHAQGSGGDDESDDGGPVLEVQGVEEDQRAAESSDDGGPVLEVQGGDEEEQKTADESDDGGPLLEVQAVEVEQRTAEPEDSDDDGPVLEVQ